MAIKARRESKGTLRWLHRPEAEVCKRQTSERNLWNEHMARVERRPDRSRCQSRRANGTLAARTVRHDAMESNGWRLIELDVHARRAERVDGEDAERSIMPLLANMSRQHPNRGLIVIRAPKQ